MGLPSILQRHLLLNQQPHQKMPLQLEGVFGTNYFSHSAVAFHFSNFYSPKKQILFNSPNKNASKTGIMKKKWRDGYYVPVGRAIVHRNSPLRAPYSTSLIQHSHSNDDRPDRAAKRINRDETVIFSRMIGCSSVSFSSPAVLKSKDIMTLNIEFHQIGSAGPAAYLPPKISFESSCFLDIAKYRKTVFPVLRPILILCGQVAGHHVSHRPLI